MTLVTLAVLGGCAIFAAWYFVCEAPRAPRGTPGICRFCQCTESDPCFDLRNNVTCSWDDPGRTVCNLCAKLRRAGAFRA